ncbi:MAG: helix-turn-helix domain-containing protein [Adlercreutzia mucosicola]|uniref:Helix-turn-helix domain-containing protein n=1 Tax=Adlercreutzia mucosicola TaxID=580026 RepID=A0A6N8JT61_9ACTN|nr:helix-turn-helix domain-containing protein [Adlercreutzia mucosicola]MCI9495897.1 helix-turn-helix domain-containing protein [Adlercreutzia mucosicola]MVX62050.1 helix-turn-helix domain-containing protein [Adlercreutzia mucosicola]
MLSVSQASEQLGVSPARVRALIKAQSLPARKCGRNWVLREEDVLARLTQRPRAGRPPIQPAEKHVDQEAPEKARELYRQCRDHFQHCPSSALIAAAESQEEASFYMAVADFFLQQRQADLIARGVF